MSGGHFFTVIHNPKYYENNPHSKWYEYYPMQSIIKKHDISYIIHQVFFERDYNDQSQVDNDMSSQIINETFIPQPFLSFGCPE